MLPGMSVSSRPVIEFRARRAHGDVDLSIVPFRIGIDASPGHAYVLLGRELDNGFTVFNAVAGFYPRSSGGLNTVRQLALTPGVVKQTLDDAKSEITFKVYITPTQEQKIAAAIQSYNDKDYNLAIQNCVSMTRDVAQVVGLRIPKLSDDPRNAIPQVFMEHLLEGNSTAERGPAPVDSALSSPPPPARPPSTAPLVDAITQRPPTGPPTIPVIPVLTPPPPVVAPVPPMPQLSVPPAAPTPPPTQIPSTGPSPSSPRRP